MKIKMLCLIGILLLCNLLIGVASTQAFGIDIREDTILKIWNIKGDCTIQFQAPANSRHLEVEANHGYYPCVESRWSSDGNKYSNRDWMKNTSYGAGQDDVWLEGSIIIPQAYKAYPDLKVTIVVGYAHNNDEMDCREGCSSIVVDFRKGGRMKFDGCTVNDWDRLIDGARKDRRLWEWANENPPNILIKSSKVSGDWAAGNFTQIFEFQFSAICNNQKNPRTFEIEFIYGIVYQGTENFRLEFGKKCLPLVVSPDKLSQTLTLTIPQNEINKSEITLINAFRWKVTEKIEGKDSIVKWFFIPVSSTLTIN